MLSTVQPPDVAVMEVRDVVRVVPASGANAPDGLKSLRLLADIRFQDSRHVACFEEASPSSDSTSLVVQVSPVLWGERLCTRVTCMVMTLTLNALSSGVCAACA